MNEVHGNIYSMFEHTASRDNTGIHPRETREDRLNVLSSMCAVNFLFWSVPRIDVGAAKRPEQADGAWGGERASLACPTQRCASSEFVFSRKLLEGSLGLSATCKSAARQIR